MLGNVNKIWWGCCSEVPIFQKRFYRLLSVPSTFKNFLFVVFVFSIYRYLPPEFHVVFLTSSYRFVIFCILVCFTIRSTKSIIAGDPVSIMNSFCIPFSFYFCCLPFPFSFNVSSISPIWCILSSDSLKGFIRFVCCFFGNFFHCSVVVLSLSACPCIVSIFPPFSQFDSDAGH